MKKFDAKTKSHMFAQNPNGNWYHSLLLKQNERRFNININMHEDFVLDPNQTNRMRFDDHSDMGKLSKKIVHLA